MTTANPFDSLYLTENMLAGKQFVQLFSPYLLLSGTSQTNRLSKLFGPGNVVLSGTQGAGKSMLLSLLKPQLRIEYSDQRTDFPPDAIGPPFVGAGINLIRSGATDFGSRLRDPTSDDLARVEASFVDFINYYICHDLLGSIELLATNDDVARSVGLRVSEAQWGAFVERVRNDDAFFGYLQDVEGLKELTARLRRRIQIYRSWLNFNSDTLDESVVHSKTSIGQPIFVFVEALRDAGIVDAETSILVRLDQYEELPKLDAHVHSSEQGRRGEFAEIVHKLVSLRDATVGFRIGTRKWAWPEHPTMHGTSGVAERLRNYEFVDMDDLLRRSENSPSPFPKFAEDVLRRRMESAGFARRQSSLKALFGSTPSQEERARIFCQHGYEPDAIEGNKVRSVLRKMSEEEPLDAKLGEAWFFQKLASQPDAEAAEGIAAKPWRRRVYWVKERRDQALLQIAADAKQRPIWGGRADLLTLSGGNILVFVSLCKFIWDTASSTGGISEVSPGSSLQRNSVQSYGIERASHFWHDKISENRDGDRRREIADALALSFRTKLRKDRKMSYPGWNAVSILWRDLESDPDLLDVLRDAASWGVLYDREHVDRSGRGQRSKWLLNPILAPYYQIPARHTKEPWYMQPRELRSLLASNGRSVTRSDQMDLGIRA